MPRLSYNHYGFYKINTCNKPSKAPLRVVYQTFQLEYRSCERKVVVNSTRNHHPRFHQKILTKIISNLLEQQRVIQWMVIQDQSRQSNSLFRHSDHF